MIELQTPHEILMSRHMSFIGQRADKIMVVGFGEMRDGTITKEVDRYTVSCDECDGDGYYDQRGDIICEGCGTVLSQRSAVIQTEYDEDNGQVGGSRGLEAPKEATPNGGTFEPS